ncbi:MAG: hypothetical protein IKX40_00770 [Thermoguttaceae bacterium]|nr:hypothetical protein [Thermoguttaceae bacterium]
MKNTGKVVLKKNNMGIVLNKKIPKKKENFPNVSEILFYTLTKELNLTLEQFNDYQMVFFICLARNNI